MFEGHLTRLGVGVGVSPSPVGHGDCAVLPASINIGLIPRLGLNWVS